MNDGIVIQKPYIEMCLFVSLIHSQRLKKSILRDFILFCFLFGLIISLSGGYINCVLVVFRSLTLSVHQCDLQIMDLHVDKIKGIL